MALLTELLKEHNVSFHETHRGQLRPDMACIKSDKALVDQQNNDLIWDLNKFAKMKLAEDFVRSFENQFCIYSGSVEQIYTNYSIFFPREESKKLVILPNPYAAHDTFNGIPEESVKATGLFVVPADPGDAKGRLNLVLPIRGRQGETRRVPFEVGLKLINSKRPPNRPFLPVLMKGDLREMDKNTPCIHMHMIQLGDLPKLSSMEKGDIQRVIVERLKEIARRQWLAIVKSFSFWRSNLLNFPYQNRIPCFLSAPVNSAPE